MANLDLGLLRHAALTAFEVNAIKILIKTGGEAPYYPGNWKPETKAMFQMMIDKGIVELRTVDETTGQQNMRLTEGLGRACADQVVKSEQQPARTIQAR
jgi:hypothetical protein